MHLATEVRTDARQRDEGLARLVLFQASYNDVLTSWRLVSNRRSNLE